MHTSPRATSRWLPALCAAALCWAFSFGVGAPLASFWLEDQGHSATVIGLNTGAYYLGIALAAPAVPWLLRRYRRGVLLAGMLASGITVAWFPLAQSLSGWFLLRILNGFAGALSLIPLETMVNRGSASQDRSRNFGYYAFCVALGIALGTALGAQIYPSTPRSAFVLGGAAALVAAFVVGQWLPWSQPAEETPEARGRVPFAPNVLSFGSAWSQGFLEGGMVALLPIFLLSTGLSEGGASFLMSGIMIGVIVFQVPVAWLADRWGRTNVLLGCYAVAGVGLAVVPFSTGTTWLALWLFLVGACSGAFYPMGLAILGERLPAPSIPRANAWYLAINCAGSVIGPACTGKIMDWYGHRGMFAAGEFAVLSIVAVWLVLRGLSLGRQRRPVAPETEAAVAERKAA